MNDEDIAPGIYFGLPESSYHRARGLSNSGMKDLAVSPLNYWHKHLNPEYVRAESDAQRFGSAMHCRLLEPERFPLRYTEKVTAADVPGCLDTVDDMKAWLATTELPGTAKRKQDYIDRIVKSGLPHPPIWDLEEARLAELNAGKVVLSKGEMSELDAMEAVVNADPHARGLLSGGVAEVSLFVREPETGVLLKARLDYVRPDATIDLKTFANFRGKSAEKAVNDAVFYEGYWRCAVVYQTVRELARQQLASGQIQTHGDVPEAWLKAFLENESPGFGLVFIESEAPYHLDMVELRAREAAGADKNVYWTTAETWMQESIYRFDECVRKFGDGEWRESARPRVLADMDLPQLIFS